MTPPSSRPSDEVACSPSCAASAAPTTSPPSTASPTAGNRPPPCNYATPAPACSTPTWPRTASATGGIDDHLDRIARAWTRHHAAGRSVAVTAQTNAHVDLLNEAIQTRRRHHGHLDPSRAVPIAAGETAGPGDLIVTRRNERTLLDEHGEPVRNREHWHIDHVHPDGSLTADRTTGPGTVRLPADYVQKHVRLGYAATAHGHQGDTVDVSYTLVSTATTHRGLYVGATRGRHDNQLHVITDTPDLGEATGILEWVLTNDRADIPAVVQRRRLAEAAHHAPTLSLEDQLTAANQAVGAAYDRAAPFEREVRDAHRRVTQATEQLANPGTPGRAGPALATPPLPPAPRGRTRRCRDRQRPSPDRRRRRPADPRVR